MLSIDTLKWLHMRAADALCGRRIVYHHVPKCGGTSVSRGLRRAYLLSQATVKPHETDQAFDAVPSERRQVGNVFALREMMLLYLLYSDCRCVTAHVPFSGSAFERFRDQYAFVTILRNPVSRFLSHYRWLHRPQSHRQTPPPLDEFLGSDRARRMGSAFVSYFSGNPAQSKVTPKLVDAAVHNLRQLDAVGFLDDLPSFESRLRVLTGRRISIGEENVGVGRGSDSAAMHGPLRERIELLCEPDREIWDAVQDLRDGSR